MVELNGKEDGFKWELTSDNLGLILNTCLDTFYLQ